MDVIVENSSNMMLSECSLLSISSKAIVFSSSNPYCTYNRHEYRIVQNSWVVHTLSATRYMDLGEQSGAPKESVVEGEVSF